jgi:tripartite ATP-independent transporter DctP family solute receptor
MKHKVLPEIVVLLGMALLCGCGSSSEDADRPKVLWIAYTMGTSELIHQSALKMAELVKSKSGGSIQVRLYPAGQLGSDQGVIEALKLGAIDAAISGSAPIGWYAPEYGVLEAPFVWRDYDHVQRVWDGLLGQEIKDAIFKRAKVRMHDIWFRGSRYLTTTERKVIHPDDLKGLKLRVPELKVYMKSWRAFGANPTPIPFNDMFMALKLGVAEGQENPLATIYGNNLYEVQQYIMETRHLIGFFIFFTGESWEKRFTPEERALLTEARCEANRWHNRNLEASEKEFRRKLMEAGVEFVEVDREAFRRIAKSEIPKQFEGIWKSGIYEKIINSK